MAISEFELKRFEKQLDKFLSKNRPPVHVRSELDVNYRIVNQSVEIFEIRTDSRNDKNKIEIPAAKATFVKAQNVWKVYWQKSDLKWHGYEPMPVVESLEEFLDIVGHDQHDCFFS